MVLAEAAERARRPSEHASGPSSAVENPKSERRMGTVVPRVAIKRAYEAPGPEDGRRYLVDRLWPRGVRTQALALSAWRKDLAPSDELRRWYGHEPSRLAEFRRRYRAELARHPGELETLRREARAGPVTLVFGAKDPAGSNAAILAELLSERAATSPPLRRRDSAPH